MNNTGQKKKKKKKEKGWLEVWNSTVKMGENCPSQ